MIETEVILVIARHRHVPSDLVGDSLNAVVTNWLLGRLANSSRSTVSSGQVLERVSILYSVWWYSAKESKVSSWIKFEDSRRRVTPWPTWKQVENGILHVGRKCKARDPPIID
jgi:hypothetical protein